MPEGGKMKPYFLQRETMFLNHFWGKISISGDLCLSLPLQSLVLGKNIMNTKDNKIIDALGMKVEIVMP